MSDATIIPAQPDTFLMNVDGRAGQPIVAWACTPAQAFPITPYSRKSITAGEAVMFQSADGSFLIYDLVWKKVFPSAEAWMDAVEVSRPYTPGDVPGANQRPAQAPPEGGDSSLVQFTGKTYERKSFWKTKGNPPYLIQLEPGGKAPSPATTEKITREEFVELKRQGVFVVVYDDGYSGKPLPLDSDLVKPIDPHEDAVGGNDRITAQTSEDGKNWKDADHGDPLSPEERAEAERDAENFGDDDDGDDLI